MMKYILFETDGMFGKSDLPIVFPALEKHSEFARGIQWGTPVEAGFVSVNHQGELYPHGESISMGLVTTERSKTAFQKLNAETY